MVWNVNEGITELQVLPRIRLTAVMAPGEYDLGNDITTFKQYVINEQELEEQAFAKETCVHFPLNNLSSRVLDIKSRWTYGIWSLSPIVAMLPLQEWKTNSVINDILWTSRNVPREHHKLDLTMYDPDRYSGTAEERVAAAQKAAQEAADAYSRTVSGQNVDSAYVTDTNTSIEYVEPRSTNYQAPNDKIKQINESIANCLGIGPVMRNQNFAGAMMSSAFEMMQALSISEIISTGFEAIIRRSLEVEFGPRFKEKELRRIKIRRKLIFEKDKTEMMRQIAIMSETGKFTATEIREAAGYEAMTPSQQEEIDAQQQVAKLQPGRVQTNKGIVAKEIEATMNPMLNYPEYQSERDKREEE